MTFTKYQFNNYCYWPSNPKKIIEFIGGSYLASKPDLAYKRFIKSLIDKNYAVHAYKYTPQFDHQELAIRAWKDFKSCQRSLSKRIGTSIPSIRIGHSLGCKLHLISPDGGRNCEKFISISFNNFSANKSIPFLKKISQKLEFTSEFSPSPERTFGIIKKTYYQKNNFLIKFNSDELDQTDKLLSCLRGRKEDNSKGIKLKGTHTIIASAGLRENFLGDWADDDFKRNTIKQISDLIDKSI
ncbi:DUF1350 family protein [Prochlorococcus sp.]|jgi:hypothetical protein|uniref:DUF1350 family protein n=1 Tax=Prochlorococcus sp. TaxID=1220 RepID=UPI003F698C97